MDILGRRALSCLLQYETQCPNTGSSQKWFLFLNSFFKYFHFSQFYWAITDMEDCISSFFFINNQSELTIKSLVGKIHSSHIWSYLRKLKISKSGKASFEKKILSKQQTTLNGDGGEQNSFHIKLSFPTWHATPTKDGKAPPHHQQRIIPHKMSVVLWLRNPHIGQENLIACLNTNVWQWINCHICVAIN